MPVVAVLCLVGPYAIQSSYFDIWVVVAFGVVGFGLRLMNYPMAPLVLGIVLGTILDSNLRRALTLVGACNVIRRRADGHMSGNITDGRGFVAALHAKGFDPAGRDMHLIGAGGAGFVIALALMEAGAARLLIGDRRPDQEAPLCARLQDLYPQARVLTEAPADFDRRLICNATPVGMGDDPAHPWPLEALAPQCLVADIVPDPPMTAWLRAARMRGHDVQTGPEMVGAQLPAVVSFILGPPP